MESVKCRCWRSGYGKTSKPCLAQCVGRSPTGRAPINPDIQNIPIHTEEGDKMRAVLEHIAWTGGTSPRPFRYVSVAEEMYTFELFWDQCNDFRGYWGDGPDSDVASIFWGRARYDAHATFLERKMLK